MDDDKPKGLFARIGEGIARFAQWIVFGLAGLFALVSLIDTGKIGIPGVSQNLVYGTAAFALVVALLNFPPLFWRLPRQGRPIAFVALLAAFFLTVTTSGSVRRAYEKTPDGQKELAAQAKEDAAERAIEAKQEAAARKKAEMLASLAEAEATQRQLAEINEKLQGCLNWRGRLPALEDPVKESLHNPSAFEHVRTVIIVPDMDGRNVAMVFRAQNAYGALRTATVKAQLVPDTCAVQAIGKPEAD
jgi:hypothetical protein